MVRSLRWKLLAWYAVILSGLACVFGWLLYANVLRSIEQDVDAELRTQANALAEVIVPDGWGKFYIQLSPRQVEYFLAEGADAFHYGIWTAGGEPIDFSHPSLTVPAPAGPGARDRGRYRELSIHGPEQTWVLVGKDVRRQRQQLRSLAAIAIGVGMAALVVMLAGGWFLTGRALAPIERISRAASAVSASNLTERIDAERMETELADLAETINDAFNRLQQAFEQQTRFTADASHELRTPLSIILSHADLALTRERSGAEYRDTLATIRRASQRMKRVVEGLLTLARADAGHIQLQRDRVDLSLLVEETCKMFRPLAAEKQVAINQDVQPVRAVGDRDRLSEAVANLLANAIQYNRPGGRVEIGLRAEEGRAELRITDTGPGIPEQERAHIFERFYRVDKARSRSVDGSGLGLAITKWIVDAHGGSVACTAGPHGGTTFIIYLPLAQGLNKRERR